MKKIAILLFVPLFFLAFSFGCIGTRIGNETKLEVTQGVGVVGSLKIAELYPGLDGFVSITVRNNLGGENAREVYVSLDNVAPFKIIECGGAQEPDTFRTSIPNCRGEESLDHKLTFRQRGVPRFLPGEELEFFWRIRAPTQKEISDISLKHPLYYDIEYSYWTNFHQNMIFMSLDEQLRRQQAKEDIYISGASGMGAGEIRLSGRTTQPVIYQFSYPQGEQEPEYNFAVRYDVKNMGSGYPLSDIVFIIVYPNEMQNTPDITETYGWYELNEGYDGTYQIISKAMASGAGTEGCTVVDKDKGILNCECRTGIFDRTGTEETVRCDDWAAQMVFDDETATRIRLNNLEGKKLIKVINRDDFLKEFSIYIPLQITADEMTSLKNNNIPLTVYTFNVYSVYRYFIEGKNNIIVYPIRGY
ncbi:MAG TPA: hypothetical protein ENN30_01165 [Candidatus Woesearchaeota archaeon]|nr:hypothetical protein [Candidatus Woesearchaeota archaeon]